MLHCVPRTGVVYQLSMVYFESFITSHVCLFEVLSSILYVALLRKAFFAISFWKHLEALGILWTHLQKHFGVTPENTSESFTSGFPCSAFMCLRATRSHISHAFSRSGAAQSGAELFTNGQYFPPQSDQIGMYFS